MVLAPRIQLKQSQKLMMNPQMQQAIALLQLTNVELTDMLQKEMDQNPFLAFDADHYRDSEGKNTERAVTVHGTSGVGLGSDVVAVRVDFAAAAGTDLTRIMEETTASADNLAAHLARQIGEEIRDPAVAAAATELVGWLDADGYLRDTDDEICAALNIDPGLLAASLAAVQVLTPPGVFARNLPDCLRLQLAADDALTPVHTALLDNLDLLGQGDFAGLAKAAGLTVDELPPYLQTIRALNPRPAAAFDAEETAPPSPDIIVLEGEAGWQAYLNEANLPSVLVLERDWEDMAARKMTDQERMFLKTNVQSARWLKKATQQRAATLLRVARAMTGVQQGFFADGPVALSPMGLRDIAEMLDIHESTVSRSAAAKTVQTPAGMFLLKDLFSNALGEAGRDGVAVSAMSVRARLAQWVREEDPLTAPLSDEALAEKLEAEGIAVARRTVAKYRKALNIPSSAARRRAAKIADAAGKA